MFEPPHGEPSTNGNNIISLITDTDLDSSLRLHKISPLRAHEEVVCQIVYAVRSGLLRAGDRLPTIEALARSTGVSKPVVGEAVRVLRASGLVETKRGVQGGVTVVEEEVPSDLLRIGGWREAALTELVEARRPIETELALLAGERATDDDLAAMHEAIDALEVAAKRPDGYFLRFDHLFHYRIGLAARSEMLAYYQHRILAAITVALREYELYHDDRDLVVSTHRDILVAIEAREPARIRAATEHHWSTSGGSFADLSSVAPTPDS
jgi:GntR family transcriptional regulator, transcriptional repressor for pyruvate dehydrogenase complex